ncbi:PRC-barrel domain-containing protein [Halarchaeum sp. P4]|uniref:PRC-barrel domain-containing protein n=1 Tax=Halarchaeum sp. P4 TaxID=3421639 RepID=UPI003EBEFA21
MDSVLASTLHDCDVMTTDGRRLGTFDRITVEPETGALAYLYVDPDGEETGGFDRGESGDLRVPAECVDAKRDYLLVEPQRTPSGD